MRRHRPQHLWRGCVPEMVRDSDQPARPPSGDRWTRNDRVDPPRVSPRRRLLGLHGTDALPWHDWDQATQRKGSGFGAAPGTSPSNTGARQFRLGLMGPRRARHGPARQRRVGPLGTLAWSTTGVDALRLDAVAHVGSDFYARWLEDLRHFHGRLASTGSGDVREPRPTCTRSPTPCSSTCLCTTTSPGIGLGR